MGKHHHGGFESQGHQNHSPEKKHRERHGHHGSHSSHASHAHRRHEHGAHRHRRPSGPESPLERGVRRALLAVVLTIFAGVLLAVLRANGIGVSDVAGFVGAALALGLGVGALIFFMRRSDREKERADTADDWDRADVPEGAGVITFLVALPSEHRARARAELGPERSAFALLADTIDRDVVAREEGSALASLAVSSSPTAIDAATGAEAASRALDSLVRRDGPNDDGGTRSTAGTGHAVLAIAIVTRAGARPPRTPHDRRQLASLVGALVPTEDEDVLHHAYRFVPEDAGRAFDDATLRATFPELRPL